MKEATKFLLAGIAVVLVVMLFRGKGSTVNIAGISTNVAPSLPPSPTNPFQALANVSRESILAVAAATCGSYPSPTQGILQTWFGVQSSIGETDTYACSEGYQSGGRVLWTVNVDKPI